MPETLLPNELIASVMPFILYRSAMKPRKPLAMSMLLTNSSPFCTTAVDVAVKEIVAGNPMKDKSTGIGNSRVAVTTASL